MIEYLKDILFPAIAILISIIAAILTIQANSKASSAARMAKEATDIANKVALGEIEISIAGMLTQSENRVTDIVLTMTPILTKENKSKEDKEQLKIYAKALEQAKEANLNAYEEACAKYRDGKIDKKRFKELYNKPIKNILESTEFDKYLQPRNSSSFQSIWEVYSEWN